MKRPIVWSLWLAGTLSAGILFAVAMLAGATSAHADAGHQAPPQFKQYGEQQPFGRAGKRAEAKRTVVVEMSDTFRFTPSSLQVKRGETVRLVFRNKGALEHEWVIGTPAEIAEHAEMMRRFPNMEHDEIHNVHVPPGGERELIWQFNRSGTFTFACLLPGHYEAGMKGTAEVQ